MNEYDFIYTLFCVRHVRYNNRYTCFIICRRCHCDDDDNGDGSGDESGVVDDDYDDDDDDKDDEDDDNDVDNGDDL